MTALANPNDDPIPYRLTAKGEAARLPKTIGSCCVYHRAGGYLDVSCGQWTPAEMDAALRRAENRRQKAACRASIYPDMPRGNALALFRREARSQVDRLATRLSFSEAAARRIWGSHTRAWWREGMKRVALFREAKQMGPNKPEIVDREIAAYLGLTIEGVPKSELVRAHRAELWSEHASVRCAGGKRCRCDIIGERSPLP